MFVIRARTFQDKNKKQKIFSSCIYFTEGVAVVLTILTVLSEPILTKIFGDGSVEVQINVFCAQLV